MGLHHVTVSEEQYEHLVVMLLVVLSHTLQWTDRLVLKSAEAVLL